ncbi:hypothetical protein WJX74_009785 [Apatococcus lobatus]|uniref:Purine permease n=1 Tax=Apatococcus lobatus TaxID=904363 RepID=A0AAW1SH33_9CHLO
METSATEAYLYSWKNPKKLLFGSGQYDYVFMCLPQWPWCRREKLKPPPFFALNEMLPVCLAAIMGLQHALAMVGGLITPPLLIGQTQPDIEITQYFIAGSLIVSGVCTIVHVLRIRFPGTRYYYGTGIISVIGTSFTFVNPVIQSIGIMRGQGISFGDAYGKILGTLLVCCWWSVALSFMPPRMLKRVFPPIVTGVTIFLIGASLITAGIQNWGGGAYCAQYDHGLPAKKYSSCLVPGPPNNSTMVPGTCFAAPVQVSCSGNGNVKLPYGSQQYLGLGLVVFVCLVVIELFGSPFMKNAEVIIALLFGYFIAAVTKYHGQSFISLDNIHVARSITFLWVHTFNIGFYWPAIMPFLVGFTITTVEAIGDISATEEASGLDTEGVEHRQRLQGGLLGDGCNSFFAALCTALPNTTFAQNNGVIVLSRCASRSAGIACGVWLILFGVLAKIGGWVTTIPNCVLGGMTTFLFANVAVSGIKVATHDGLPRRSRFILAVSIGLGLGVTLVPDFIANNFWGANHHSQGLNSFRNAVVLVLSNGFSIGCLSAVALNLLLPYEQSTEMQNVSYVPGGVHPVDPNGKVMDPDFEVTKADMQPAKTEAMLRGTEDHMDDSARGTSTLHRISVNDHRSPGPAGKGLNGANAV